MARVVVWSGLDAWRCELAEVELEADGLRARGVQIGIDPLPYRVDYRLDASGAGFTTRSLRVEAAGEGWARRLRLERDEVGEWTIEVGGEGEAELAAPGGDVDPLAGALDCDLAFSPLTNAMPVARHRLGESEGGGTFLMAWVAVPDLTVTPSRQHYTHVRAGAEGSIVRYQSESRDFVADLELDPEGLVRVYPQLARRVEAGAGASVV